MRTSLSAEFDTLHRGARAPRDLSVASADDVARGVQCVLRSPASARAATVRAGVTQRHSSQIDGSDVGAGDRAQILQAFQHRITDISSSHNFFQETSRLQSARPSRRGRPRKYLPFAPGVHSPSSARPGNLAPGRARCRRDAQNQVLFREPAADRVAVAHCPAGASTVGDRAAVSRPQGRARPRSFSERAHVQRVASPYGARHNQQLVKDRATTGSRPPDLSNRARHCAGNLHDISVCAATAITHAHRGPRSVRLQLTKHY